jgi:hypothetical protein
LLIHDKKNEWIWKREFSLPLDELNIQS